MPDREGVAWDRLSWKPGVGAAACLLISLMVSVWLMSPLLWNSIGGDDRAFHAAGRIAARGLNPYDQGLIREEEVEMNAEARAHGSGRTAIYALPYLYPPVMTRGFQALSPAGDAVFIVVLDAIFLAAGLLGFELVLMALNWHGRWWPRLFFLASVPLFEALFSSNPSPLLLLGLGAAFLAMRRNRLLLAGALLAVGLIKIPVGVPVAAAMILAIPGGRGRLLAGAGLGTVAFALVNVAAGPGETIAWVQSLLPLSATLDVHQTVVAKQCCLAGLSAPFFGLGPIWANLIAVLLVAVLLAWLARTGALRDAVRRRPLIVMGLLLAVAMAVAPYSHPNDLVLEALPLLLLASLPLTLLNRVTFALWALSVPISLILVLGIRVTGGDVNQSWSYGVVLSAITLVALAAATARSEREQPAAREAAVVSGGPA